MERHGQADGAHEPNILPRGHPQQGLVFGQAAEQGEAGETCPPKGKACALTDRVCLKPHFNKVMAALALPTDLNVLSFYGGKVKE